METNETNDVTHEVGVTKSGYDSAVKYIGCKFVAFLGTVNE